VYFAHFFSPAFHNCTPRAPTLLSICAESRALALSPSFPSPSTLLKVQASNTERLPPKWVAGPLPIYPERDTVFLRSFGGSLYDFAVRCTDFHGLRHLALPFSGMLLGPRRELKAVLRRFPELETLTLVVGSGALGFARGETWVQLRDVEEWFADGRERMAKLYGDLEMDVGVVAKWLERRLRLVGMAGYVVVRPNFKVRVVAARRGC